MRRVFLGLQGVLYVSFLAQDLLQQSSTGLKYASICLCLAAALYQWIQTKDGLLLTAMGFTLFADTFLLLRNDHYIVGVLAFCVVQTLYAIRLLRFSGGGWRQVGIRIGAFGGAVLLLGLIGMLDGLTAAAAWSFTQLTINGIEAWRQRGRSRGARWFAWGLLLFLACDTCVGLHNLLGYWPHFPLAGLIGAASFGMWLFYLPAQVLIVLSAERMETNEGE